LGGVPFRDNQTIPTVNCLRSFQLTIYVGVAVNAGPEALLDTDWESFAAQIRNLSSRKPLPCHIVVEFDTSAVYNPGETAPGPEMSKSICSKPLRKLVKEQLRILWRDPVITIIDIPGTWWLRQAYLAN